MTPPFSRVPVTVVKRWHVLVKMPKERNRKHDVWATVGIVSNADEGMAIVEAINGAPELLDYVPAGLMHIMAIPMGEVKIHPVLVTERGKVEGQQN